MVKQISNLADVHIGLATQLGVELGEFCILTLGDVCFLFLLLARLLGQLACVLFLIEKNKQIDLV